MKPVNPGEFNTRITIGKIGSDRGPLGNPIPAAFTPIGNAWAKAELTSNKTVRTADQGVVVETWQFTMQPRSVFNTVASGWKVQVGSVMHSVRNADRSQKDRFIITTEVDPTHDRAGT